jgi:hypothetical protein
MVEFKERNIISSEYDKDLINNLTISFIRLRADNYYLNVNLKTSGKKKEFAEVGF